MLMGTYLGTTANPNYYVGGVGGGAIAFVWGLLIFRQRLSREVRRPCSTYDEYLDQTCELNFRPDAAPEHVSGQTQEQA